MVTLTATPSARERAATAKSPGAWRRERNAYFRSWRSVSIETVSGQRSTADGELPRLVRSVHLRRQGGAGFTSHTWQGHRPAHGGSHRAAHGSSHREARRAEAISSGVVSWAPPPPPSVTARSSSAAA